MHLVGATGGQRIPRFTLSLGNCVELLESVPSASVDAIVSDPPYPEIDRDYGRFTVDEWFELMRAVVVQSRRILKPQGSAVFVLQPTIEYLGRMRPWLWEWLAEVSRSWNVVQDAYWWNHTTPPSATSNAGGMMRGSLKYCVWLGEPDCVRYQDEILWTEAEASAANRLSARARGKARPSGININDDVAYAAAVRRGGVTPFNVWPIPASDSRGPRGALKHPAATPAQLCSRWIRFLTRPGDLVVDPFTGGGTVGRVALQLGRDFLGCEQIPEYYQLATDQLTAAVETWDQDQAA